MAARVAVLYSAQMGGLAFANLIAAGVFSGLDGRRGLAGWRWYVDISSSTIAPHKTRLTNGYRMLILEGVASALTALLGFWLLPGTLANTRWLSKEERDLGQLRMEKDRLINTQEHEPVRDALVNALRDSRTWLFCALQNFHYAGLSFINFLPT